MASLIFGKYEIIRRLAIGGMGEIFLSRQVGLPGFDRLVILKSLLPELAAQDKFVEQFLDEARVAAKLNHPNIVAIYEVGLWEGTYFIAMEYIHGVSLAELLRELVSQEELIPIPIAARIIHDACVALDHAHRATDAQGNSLNIVHRDVSPQNIMVRDDGYTKVVDFGIARAANRASRTSTGELKGKLRYMPPEQFARGDIDGRSDQFALGVCFWELCARRQLFRGDNPVEIFHDLTQSDIPSPRRYAPDFPAQLDEIVLRMLQREPSARYASCREAAEALRGYLRSLPEEVEEQQVSQYIMATMGTHLGQVAADLTPDKQNFVLSLRSPTGQKALTPTTAASATPETRVIERGRLLGSRRRWLVIGAGSAAAVLVLILALALRTQEAPGGARFDAGTGDGTAADAGKAVGAVPAAAASEPTSSLLELTSTPPGATVLVGELVLGETPVAIDRLAPGTTHTLVLERRGFEPATLQVHLEPGQTIKREVQLQRRRTAGSARRPPRASQRPRPPEPPTPPRLAAPVQGDGFLTIKTTPWTKVDIDGEPRGSTPLFKLKLPAGVHTLRLVNDQEGISRNRQVRITAGQTTKLNLTLK